MVLKELKRNSHGKCFVPKVKITNYNLSMDGRNFCIANQLKTTTTTTTKTTMRLETLQ